MGQRGNTSRRVFKESDFLPARDQRNADIFVPTDPAKDLIGQQGKWAAFGENLGHRGSEEAGRRCVQGKWVLLREKRSV